MSDRLQQIRELVADGVFAPNGEVAYLLGVNIVLAECMTVMHAQRAEIESLRMELDRARNGIGARVMRSAANDAPGLMQELGVARDENDSLRRQVAELRSLGVSIHKRVDEATKHLQGELAESQAEVEWLRTLCGVAAPYIADAIPLHREAGYATGNLQALFDLLIAAGREQ